MKTLFEGVTASSEHCCAKCLTPMPVPDFVVNKQMVYCAECAQLLKLGESKESRMFKDFQDAEPPRPDPSILIEEGLSEDGLA